MILFRMADQTPKPRPSSWIFRCQFQTRVVVLAAVLLAVVQAPGQSLQPDEAHSEILRGTVINAATKLPIPRALVCSGDNRFAAMTDGDGHFEFTLPKQSSDGSMAEGGIGSFAGLGRQLWSFRAARNGLFLMARKPGFLGDSDQGAEAVASSDNDVTISLTPESVIKGRVTIAGGDAALGMVVQLFSLEVTEGLPRWVPGPAAQVNSSGEFRFAELRPGTYKLVTREWMDNDPVAMLPGSQLYGFPPTYYPGVAEFAAAAAIHLGAGQTFEAELSPVRQPYYEVKIPVADRDANAGLNVFVQGQRGSIYELGYNSQKQSIEGLLPSGNYVVHASTSGPGSVSGTVSFRVAGEPVHGPVMALTPNSSVPLNVKEEFTDASWNGSGTWGEGKRAFALHGPRLYLQATVESADDFEQRGGGIRPPAGSNDDTLALESLPPGRYWLRLNTLRGYVASATMGSADLLRQPFVIGSGPGAPIDIELRDDGAEVDGTVTAIAEHNASSDSTPTRAWVYFVPAPESAGQFQQLGIAEDGKFMIPMMAPGDYLVLAFSSPQMRLPYRDAEAMKPYQTKGSVVHLTAGQKTTVQVPIISAAE